MASDRGSYLFAFLVAVAHLIPVALVQASAADAREERPALGKFISRYFSPQEHGGSPQNWAAAQDTSGIVYVGNSAGLLIYDGNSWDFLALPNGSIVRSLKHDRELNRVYVGGFGVFGYIIPDSAGSPSFHSLLPYLPEGSKPFADVWQIRMRGETVFFITHEAVFSYDPGSDDGGIRVLNAPYPLRYAAVSGDMLYVAGADSPVLKFVGESPVYVRRDSTAESDLFALLPEEDSILLMSTSTGIIQIDPSAETRRLTPFRQPIEHLLPYHAARLRDGRIAIATLRGGVVLMRRDGSVERVIDRAGELHINGVKHVMEDVHGGLWVLMDRGIVRVEPSPTTTYFDADSGIEGAVYGLARHRGSLYATTSGGVFRLSPAGHESEPAAFTRVSGTWDACHALLELDNRLLAGCDEGVYEIRPGGAHRLVSLPIVYALAPSRFDPSIVYAGMNSGLARVRFSARGIAVDTARAVSAQIRMIIEDEYGNIWLGTNHDGLIRVNWPAAPAAEPAVMEFPFWSNLRVHTFMVDGRPIFAHAEGIFRYAPREPSDTPPFVRDEALSNALAEVPQAIFRLGEAPGGHLWMRIAGVNGVAYREGTGYRWDIRPLSHLPPHPTYVLYPEDDNVVWIGGGERLYRFEDRTDAREDMRFQPILRYVATIGDEQILFGGVPAGRPPEMELPFAMNALRFRFALPDVRHGDRIQYSVRLEGRDAGWSDWSTENVREYARLGGGRYRLHIRARDVHGRITEAATFSFAINSPWYQTWWAYLLYVVIAAGLLAASIRWRSAHIEEKTRSLGALVLDRTAEIEHQKTELLKSRDRIREQARQLQALDEMKSRFFAEVSHEFRTPLTLTIGPLEDVQRGAFGPFPEAARDPLRLALRNARRMLKLINQLLDLSRIESGHLALHPRDHDVTALLRHTASAFSPLAERQNIRYRISLPQESLYAQVEEDQLEKIVTNLLSNAFKYTPGGRAIAFGADFRDGSEQDEVILTIRVRDTGPGIPADRLPHIFDRYYRVESTAGDRTGSGIGLALVRRLVNLHDGTVTVSSEVGFGTEFRVSLPLKRSPTGAIMSEAEGDGMPHGAVEAALLLPTSPGSAGPASEHPADREIVLLVEDNDEVRQYVRNHIAADYHVLEAATAEDALELLGEQAPDLILSDLMLPGMDGSDLCRRIRSMPGLNFTPIILLTARADTDSRVQAFDHGADQYITKPFDSSELLARIRNLIKGRKRLLESARRTGRILPASPDLASADEAYLERINRILDEQAADAEFGVEELAREAGQSRSQLHRRLRELTGTAPGEVIRQFRLQKAAHMLKRRAGSVGEIAFACGFKSVAYFSKCFKDEFGTVPSLFVHADGPDEPAG